MSNEAIARVFSRIADLMEIKGEDPFRIRAYRTAAAVIREWPERLDVLAERGELETIPGIGPAIAAKTRDILATGTTRAYERLKAEVPEELIELLELPSFGPAKVRAVWQKLGVRSLDDLERSAREGRLREVPGFGPRSEENVLRAVAAHRLRRQRAPIGTMLPAAETLVDTLRRSDLFHRVEVAGSVRRMQETAADLDLAAAAEAPERALDAFCNHPEVREVLQRAPGSVRVATRGGWRADLYVSVPEAFGATLARATGSAAHVARLAELAAAHGWTLDSQGLQAGGTLLPTPEEEDFYRRLGLPWIPPELREDRGEIEAAREGRLPRLVEAADYRGCLHAHSLWSDGSAGIAAMAAAARALGYAYHAVTDHSRTLAVARGLDAERLLAQMEEIDALNAASPDGFRVLKGIECDILPDGTLDLPHDLLARLDVVIASIHSRHRMDEDAMTERIVRALRSGVVHILAHPTGRLLGQRDPYPVDLERVMEVALEQRVALEINAFPDRLDLNDAGARRAKARGLLLSINPDAHRPEHLGLLRYGLGQARRAWLAPDDVINTWPLDRLLAWLRERPG